MISPGADGYGRPPSPQVDRREVCPHLCTRSAGRIVKSVVPTMNAESRSDGEDTLGRHERRGGGARWARTVGIVAPARIPGLRRLSLGRGIFPREGVARNRIPGLRRLSLGRSLRGGAAALLVALSPVGGCELSFSGRQRALSLCRTARALFRGVGALFFSSR
jgi:hypothetical protein